MLTLATRIRTLAFVVISVSVIAFIGARYADLGRFVGMRGYYVAKLELAETGGLFPGSNITYRGVSVGRVGELHLTGDGVVADLKIDDSAPRIPANLRAVVANLSAVGEQYVDLRPANSSAPYLRDGAVIPRSTTSTPAPVTDLLKAANDFTRSVPTTALQTVVNEFYLAFNGQGPNLQALMDAQNEFIRAADANIDPTSTLIRDGELALRTQNQEAAALKAFAGNARLLAEQLRTSDSDLRKLIAVAPQASTEVTGLLRDLDPSLSVVIANLLTVSDLAVTRVDGLEELMVRLPGVVAAGSTIVQDDGTLRFGMATTFFNPLPCMRGYGGTTYRNGLNLSAAPPLNTGARCTMPASSGVNVRGSANAPKGGVPVPARPGSLGAAGAAALPGALGLPGVEPREPDMADLLGLRGER
ncbi:MlaD family protein [Spirillospora sp. NPDC029432]|uniref:MlaD family protein n=1 Tax=Spirillospora sp. NPDC029432 TaxID=3154599 RepID=UPI003454CA5B